VNLLSGILGSYRLVTVSSPLCLPGGSTILGRGLRSLIAASFHA